MGLFTSIFRSRDRPKNLSGGTSFFMGSSSSGKVVTERSAMQMTAVYACVRILSEAIAGLPLHLYKYTSESKKEKAGPDPDAEGQAELQVLRKIFRQRRQVRASERAVRILPQAPYGVAVAE